MTDKEYCYLKALAVASNEFNYKLLKLLESGQFTEDNIQIEENNAFDYFIFCYSDTYHRNVNLDNRIKQLKEIISNFQIKDDPSLDTIRDRVLKWIEDIHWAVIKWSN
jgi:hypothetical protein